MDKLYLYSKKLLAVDLPETVIKKPLFFNKKIIIISPHSDDISVSMGGAVSLLSRENKIIPVSFFCGHRGVKGESDRISCEIRENEMKNECNVLGMQEPVFLRFKSYNKESTSIDENEVLQIEKFLHKEKPDLIFLPKKDDFHPRHQLATQITLKALKHPRLNNKADKKAPVLFFYENPWSLFGAFEFNVAFVLPKSVVLKKIEAIKQHSSQLARTQFDKAALSLTAFRGAVIPEQRIFGYGNDIDKKLDLYIETFLYDNNN